MSVKIVAKIPEIHSVPLSSIDINENPYRQVIEFDDVNEKRWRLTLKPVYAWKITSIDCFDGTILTSNLEVFNQGRYSAYILEVLDSPWIQELVKLDKCRSNCEHEVEKSHHYILHLGDHVIEVVAWDNYEIKMIEEK